MDVCKNFILLFRKKQLEESYLFLTDDITGKMKNYVRLLKEVKFEGGNYQKFYGDVKKIIASYVGWFSCVIDEVIKEADRCKNQLDKNDLIILTQRTIDMHQAIQIQFGHDFLPVNSPEEKQIYEEVEKEYEALMTKLYDMRCIMEKYNKVEQVQEFSKDHFELSITKTSELFNFGYVYLGIICADYLDQIRISLEEILIRMTHNLKRLTEENEEAVNNLLLQLYEKNKENRTFSRMERKSSVAMAEVSRGIENLKSRIENFKSDVSLTRLADEVEYWTNRNEEFKVIADNLTKLKAEQDNVLQSLYASETMKCNELPGQKSQGWDTILVNLAQRKQDIEQMIVEEMKALMTFFACRGTDHIFYTDNVGPYYLDEFNHQVYVFDHGLGIYHVNCEGEFREYEDKPYFFDKHGRFINDNGRKLYQCSLCTSQYELDDCDLLNKVTQDCGHSEVKEKCRMEIRDPTLVEILPESAPIDIKGTLPSETVKYLWDSFGSLLPQALHDVGTVRPSNPIHFLAHKLLYHKYKRTADELLEKKREAEQYRANIFNKRKEKALTANKLWKSKQIKRRKPEELDNSDYHAAYDAHAAQQMFIQALNFYND